MVVYHLDACSELSAVILSSVVFSSRVTLSSFAAAAIRGSTASSPIAYSIGSQVDERYGPTIMSSHVRVLPLHDPSVRFAFSALSAIELKLEDA
ncbi:hypothetical protein LTR74_007370 [Friedmanniomyces endolithicus]|nr:hypothetical protein LTR74_007370 [Friedmanniomyces endolithicus]